LYLLKIDIGQSIAIDRARVQRDQKGENTQMRDYLMKLYVKAQIFREDNGQDLIEYALVAALIALAAVVGMNALAGKINTAFSTVGGHLASNVT
jgi:pilus assembly protein Flp/PilA